MATQVLSQIANYLATVPLQRKQQQYENELANRRLALQEDEAKRKAEADTLALENAQFEQQQRNEGQQQLRDYYQAAEIQPSINELKQGKELTKNVAPYSMDYLLAQPEATPLALTDKYKLSQYSGYNEGVKSTLEQLNKRYEFEQKQVRAPGVYGARLDAFRTNPNAVPELIQSIENYYAIGKLKDHEYNYLMARIKTDPVQASLAMDDIVIKPLVAGEIISAQTDPKVEQKYKLIDPEAEEAEATAKAGKIGGIKGETEANQTAIPGFKPIAVVNITNDSVKKVKSAASQIEMMKKLADDLITKYNKMGTVFTGDDAADYSSKVRNLQLMAKGPEFYNLGVLTGPDLDLLEQTIPNPSSIKEGVKKTVLGDLSVKLNNFKDMLNTKSQQFYRFNGFEQETPQKQKKVYNPQTGKFELR